MKIIFLNIATAKEDWSSIAEQLYLKKISHFHHVELKSLKSSKQGRDSALEKKATEAELVLDYLEDSDFLVLLDETGNTLSSRDFAKKFENWLMTGKKRIVFLVGGAYGVDKSVQDRADYQLSLSKLVFNHLVAQTVLLEQVYRALMIKNNLPYHND